MHCKGLCRSNWRTKEQSKWIPEASNLALKALTNRAFAHRKVDELEVAFTMGQKSKPTRATGKCAAATGGAWN